MSSGAPLIEAPKIGQQAVAAVAWTEIAITSTFLAFRLFVRIKVFRRLSLDDAFVILAWIFLLGAILAFQLKADDIFLVIGVLEGHIHPPPQDFPSKIISTRHSQWFSALFYSVGIWSIKISFLVFFKKLSQNVRKQKALWWLTFVVTIVALCIVVPISGWQCLMSNSLAQIEGYCQTNSFQKYSHFSIGFTTALDILTDLLIGSLPIALLWNVKITRRQKLGIGGLFSLTAITMAVSIARTAVVLSALNVPDETLLYLWSTLEQSVAIVIACLVSYRAWFTRHKQPSRLPDGNYESTSHATKSNPPQTSHQMSTLKSFGNTAVTTRLSSDRKHQHKSLPALPLKEQYPPLDDIGNKV